MKKEYINPEMTVLGYEPTLLQSASALNQSGGKPSGSLAPDYDEENDEDWGDDAAAGY